MKKNIEYSTKGFVWGNLWGGGCGGYDACKLSSDDREDLIKQVYDGLADGSLDAGMGFESLKGAALFVTTTTTINIDGDDYVNTKSDVEIIGDLSDDECEDLEILLFNEY